MERIVTHHPQCYFQNQYNPYSKGRGLANYTVSQLTFLHFFYF